MFERREGLVHPKSGKPLGFERGLPSFGSSLGSLWSVHVPRAFYPEQPAAASPKRRWTNVVAGFVLAPKAREAIFRAELLITNGES